MNLETLMLAIITVVINARINLLIPLWLKGLPLGRKAFIPRSNPRNRPRLSPTERKTTSRSRERGNKITTKEYPGTTRKKIASRKKRRWIIPISEITTPMEISSNDVSKKACPYVGNLSLNDIFNPPINL